MYTSISMREVMNLKGLKIIDVRESEEHANGTIVGALRVPMNTIPEVMKDYSKDQKYYIVCQSGSRSQVACQYLAKNGFDVVNVLGGMSSYLGELEYEV